MKKISLNCGDAYVLDSSFIPDLSAPFFCPELQEIRQFANVPSNVYRFCDDDKYITCPFIFYYEPCIDYTLFVLEDMMFILPCQYELEFNLGDTNRLFVRQLLFNLVNAFFSDLLMR